MKRIALASYAIAAAIGYTIPSRSQGASPFTVVETGQAFGTLQDAVRAIAGGSGTVAIAPGEYGDCAVQEAGNITYRAAVAGQVIFNGGVCEDKATLVLRGRSARVDGIVFTHTYVDDGNGAGIRLETGDLFVQNAMFLDAQGGILTANGIPDRIEIDRSTFSGLGKDPRGNGAHSLYVGDYGSLKVTRTRFERGQGGHYVKSRAPRAEILDNSFDDSQGSHTNYMIDLSGGAQGRIAGNSFAVGLSKENHSALVTVAPEGRAYPSSGLVIENNRAWIAPGFPWRTTFVANWSNEPLVIRNNTLARGIAVYEDR